MTLLASQRIGRQDCLEWKRMNRMIPRKFLKPEMGRKRVIKRESEVYNPLGHMRSPSTALDFLNHLMRLRACAASHGGISIRISSSTTMRVWGVLAVILVHLPLDRHNQNADVREQESHADDARLLIGAGRERKRANEGLRQMRDEGVMKRIEDIFKESGYLGLGAGSAKTN